MGLHWKRFFEGILIAPLKPSYTQVGIDSAPVQMCHSKCLSFSGSNAAAATVATSAVQPGNSYGSQENTVMQPHSMNTGQAILPGSTAMAQPQTASAQQSITTMASGTLSAPQQSARPQQQPQNGTQIEGLFLASPRQTV